MTSEEDETSADDGASIDEEIPSDVPDIGELNVEEPSDTEPSVGDEPPAPPVGQAAPVTASLVSKSDDGVTLHVSGWAYKIELVLKDPDSGAELSRTTLLDSPYDVLFDQDVFIDASRLPAAVSIDYWNTVPAGEGDILTGNASGGQARPAAAPYYSYTVASSQAGVRAVRYVAEAETEEKEGTIDLGVITADVELSIVKLSQNTTGASLRAIGEGVKMIVTNGAGKTVKEYTSGSTTKNTKLIIDFEVKDDDLPDTFTARITKLDGSSQEVSTDEISKNSYDKLPAPKNLVVHLDTFMASWSVVDGAAGYLVSAYVIKRGEPDSEQELLDGSPFTTKSEYFSLKEALEGAADGDDIKETFRVLTVVVQPVAADLTVGASARYTLLIPSGETADTAPVQPSVAWRYHYLDGSIRVSVIVNAHGVEITESNGGQTATRIVGPKDLTSMNNHYEELLHLQPTAYPYELVVTAYNNAPNGQKLESRTTLRITSNTHPTGPVLVYDDVNQSVYLKSTADLYMVDYTGWVVTSGGSTRYFSYLNKDPKTALTPEAIGEILGDSTYSLQEGDVIYAQAQTWTLNSSGTYVQSQKSSAAVMKVKTVVTEDVELSMSGTVYEDSPTKVNIRVNVKGPVKADSMLSVFDSVGNVVGTVPGTQLVGRSSFDFTVSPIVPGDYKAVYSEPGFTSDDESKDTLNVLYADWSNPAGVGATIGTGLFVNATGTLVFTQDGYIDGYPKGYLSWNWDFLSENITQCSFIVHEIISANGTINKTTNTTGTRISIPSSSSVLSNAYVAYSVRTIRTFDADGKLKLISKPCPAYVYKGVDSPDYATNNPNTSWDDDPDNPWSDSDGSGSSALWFDGFYYRDSNGGYYDSNKNYIGPDDPNGYNGDGVSSGTYTPPNYSDNSSSSSSTEVANVSETVNSPSPYRSFYYGDSLEPSGNDQIPLEFVSAQYAVDPSMSNNTVLEPLLGKLFEPLVDQGATDLSDVKLANAKEYSLSDDGLTYTFYLRDGLMWSDGSKLTAEDYVYTFKRILDPSSGSENARMLIEHLEGAEEYNAGKADESALGVKAIDADTLEFKLKDQYDLFLYELSFWGYAPVLKSAIEGSDGSFLMQDASKYISNGPYRVKSITPQQIILEPNPNYNGTNMASGDVVIELY
ncbi:MAG: ABC transporter substrate-binding protein [Oscillospiraceae bacterium]|nr:ABC transporter substrate-binding protein [Oscillospiraceae bacterium]